MAERRLTVPEVAPVLDAFYALPGNAGGGAVHVVTEDGNTEDGHVDWCIDWARSMFDREGEAMASILRRCSRTQRAKLHRQHGYPLTDESRRPEFWALIEALG